MKSYSLDLAKYLPSNTTCKLYLADKPGELGKLNKVYLLKNDAGKLYCDYEKPITLNIDGHNIPNVSSYSVVNYKDAATNNGKLYNIRTGKSNISFYTHDDKFAMLREYFQDAQSLDIKGKKYYGHITRVLFKDGTQKYEVISPNYKTNVIRLDALGREVMPKKTKQLQCINKLFKQTSKLLKFLF